MKKNVYLSVIVTSLLFMACPHNYGYDYPSGKFPVNPVNLESVNSEFDDYNMTSPVLENRTTLMFSSNRNSLGGNFDIVGGNIFLEWSKTKGILTESVETLDTIVTNILNKINTNQNEYAPFMITDNFIYDYSRIIACIFSRGNQDSLKSYLSFSKRIKIGSSRYKWESDSIIELKLINSKGTSNGYVCFNNSYEYITTIEDLTDRKIFFSSNREGNFNIYQINIPDTVNFWSYITEEHPENIAVKVEELSSNGNDKCPYVHNDKIVFVSDRDGGKGGTDIYYSKIINGKWETPKNLSNINSEKDEYRPILPNFDDYNFNNNLIMFSSNRDGGKGGFDLYYAGFDE